MSWLLLYDSTAFDIIKLNRLPEAFPTIFTASVLGLLLAINFLFTIDANDSLIKPNLTDELALLRCRARDVAFALPDLDIRSLRSKIYMTEP